MTGGSTMIDRRRRSHPFERRWPELADEYPKLRERAEAAVVDWRWAPSDATLHVREPLFAERIGAPARGLLRNEPADKSDVLEYGFDARDRIVVARLHAFGDRYEDLFFPSARRVEWVSFGFLGGAPQPVPQGLGEYVYSGGRLVTHRRYGPPIGWSSERYEYRDGLVVGIEFVAHLPDRETHDHWVAEYDASGRLTRLREQRTGTVVVERHAPPCPRARRRPPIRWWPDRPRGARL
jgi:hypothetical protein